MKLIALSALLVGARAAFTINPVTSLPPAQTCQDKVVSLNEGDNWVLPLTRLANSQICTYQFIIPSDCYALLDLTGFFIGDWEQINLHDSFGDLDVRFLVNPYVSSGAWPSNFSIHIETNEDTRMQITWNITVVATRSLDDVTDVAVGVDQPPALQYFSNWPAGKTYHFKAESGSMAVYPVPYTDNIDFDNVLRNVFVYNDSVLIGTLMSIMGPAKCPLKNPYISDLMLYAPVQPQTRGAAIIIDFANIDKTGCYFATYVPYRYPQMTNYYLLNGDQFGYPNSALTLVGDMDGSSPIDILSFNTTWGNGTLSVASSGPMANHSSAMTLISSALPIHLTGNIWTLYLSDGGVNVTIHTNATLN